MAPQQRAPRRVFSRKRRAGGALAALVWCWATAAPAQPAPVEIHRDLARQLRALQFSVVGGRIVANSQIFDRSGDSSARQGDLEERLSINLTTRDPSFSYEARGPRGRLTIELDQAQTLLIDDAPEGDGAVPFRFEQRPYAQLQLQLGPPETERVVRGSMLWHLWLAEPALCQERLLPILLALRPDWDLAGVASRVEEALLRAASGGRVPDRQRWQILVAQLASDGFARRREADRQLRMAGQAVVPFLQGLPPESLDAEQRFRVRQIIAVLASDQREDQPQAVASWLVADPQVWFSLLAREDTELRTLAAAQLRKLLDGPLDFDPAADAAQRAAQLDALRPRFETAPARPAQP